MQGENVFKMWVIQRASNRLDFQKISTSFDYKYVLSFDFLLIAPVLNTSDLVDSLCAARYMWAESHHHHHRLRFCSRKPSVFILHLAFYFLDFGVVFLFSSAASCFWSRTLPKNSLAAAAADCVQIYVVQYICWNHKDFFFVQNLVFSRRPDCDMQ